MEASIFDKIRKAFDHVPEEDPRAKIGPLSFLVTLVFSLATDSKRKSLDGLRRKLIAQMKIPIARSTFWQRLATDKLRRFLVKTFSRLIEGLAATIDVNREILSILKVKGIYLVDSCSTSLPDAAKKSYPAPRNNVVAAAIKWHVCIDLLSGCIHWSALTPATNHDRKHFPHLSLLKGILVIFDLGYWDYKLLADLIEGGCFFLCRVKNRAIINIIGSADGSPKYKLLGRNLFEFNWKRNRGNIIELLGSFSHQGEELFQARIVGFWNPVSGYYHWYATNLTVAAKLVYPAYRLRWQIELLFKAAKGSLRLEDIPSANHNIIWNLILSSLIASLISQPLAREISEDEESTEKKRSLSYQRAVTIMRHAAHEFRDFVLKGGFIALQNLKEKLALFVRELFDPNYKSRATTIGSIIACSTA